MLLSICESAIILTECRKNIMAQITVRQIPNEVHHALKAQAERDGMSAEAKARQILADGLLPENRPKPGDVLRSLWQGVGDDLDDVDFPRDRTPIQGADLA
jgi:plasmid stability protein